MAGRHDNTRAPEKTLVEVAADIDALSRAALTPWPPTPRSPPMTRPLISTGPPFPDHKYPNTPWCVTYKAGATGNLRVDRHYSRHEDAKAAEQAHRPR